MYVTVLKEVEKFIRSLETRISAKVFRSLYLLEDYGHELRMPYSKYIGDHFFELRIRDREREVRIIYIFYKGGAIALHGFIKKTQRIPERELKIARIRRRRLTVI